ncbi:MAG: amidohydrolase, partial [Oscillospiraceae bacterium]
MSKTLYYGGDIITLEKELYAQAVLTQDGKILEVGTKAQLEPLAQHSVDLRGKTMLPAFIDSHSHLTGFANTMVIAQLEDLTSLEEIKEKLLEFIKTSNLKKGEWVMGFGYDQNTLPEKNHPTKEFLDSVTTDFPVLITHASGHMGVASTAALELLGVDKNTPNIAGGVIGKDEKGELTGYLEEKAFTTLSAKMPRPTMKDITDNIKKAEQEYFKHGITTVQDGFTTDKEWAILSYMAQNKQLAADVVCYVDLKDSKAILKNEEYKNRYNNNLKIGGYKIFLDGSPQGRTAWMKESYQDDKEYFGYPIYKDEQVEKFVVESLEENQQLLTHCNGDAAAQQLIDAYKLADKQLGFTDNIRPVMIHSQLVGQGQLSQMAQLKMIASFFVAHTYYWGDIHLKNFGTRGENISPVNSAIKAGVPVTFHQDCPVLPPNMLFSMWCACTRKTKL